jgi:hypothetical protein
MRAARAHISTMRHACQQDRRGVVGGLRACRRGVARPSNVKSIAAVATGGEAVQLGVLALMRQHIGPQ